MCKKFKKCNNETMRCIDCKKCINKSNLSDHKKREHKIKGEI